MSGTRLREARAKRPARDRQRAGESGSVVMIFGLVFAIIIGMVIAGMVLGRQSIVRRELQTAADAAALAGAYCLEQHGKPMGLPVWAPAVSLVGPNTGLSVGTPVFRHEHRSDRPLTTLHEHRVVVTVDLAGTFDSEQAWFQRLFTIRARAHAQVNEQVFSQEWPALTIILDASQSMEMPILAGTGAQAYEVLRDALTNYATNTLPVRNGLVIFNQVVVEEAQPPPTNANNLAAIVTAFQSASNRILATCPAPNPPTIPDQRAPCGPTNTEAALLAARQQQASQTVGRNVLLISDGEPTLSITGACAPNDPCHFTAAENEATRVRNDARAALFTTEIRRTNYTGQTTTFLQNIAGPPGSGGGDPAYAVPSIQGPLGIRNFMQTLTASICAFGPLDPGPGALPDGFRPRRGTPDLLVWSAAGAVLRQRVFAFIREAGGGETVIPPVPDRTLTNGPGFELVVDPNDGANYVVLTLASCNVLGGHWARTLVVRWDDAQLVRAP